MSPLALYTQEHYALPPPTATAYLNTAFRHCLFPLTSRRSISQPQLDEYEATRKTNN